MVKSMKNVWCWTITLLLTSNHHHLHLKRACWAFHFSVASSSHRVRPTWALGYQSASHQPFVYHQQVDDAPLGVDTSLYDSNRSVINGMEHKPLPVHDPSLVEFASTEDLKSSSSATGKKAEPTVDWSSLFGSVHYPFAVMMQGCAPYIAAHAGKLAVFHIPGELVDHPSADNLFCDIALAWLLGMKIVLVAGSRYDMDDTCDVDSVNFSHECHNILKVTDAESLRRVEEEAGFLRTEIERKLNKSLRMHGAIHSSASDEDEGNVVSGNFYNAQRFGRVRGEDFQYTGFAAHVHSENIHRVLDNNDVVLLTTVGVSTLGELVHVNGYHLAAWVAASLKAHKVIYFSSQDSVLRNKNDHTATIQELPLSFALAITDYHQVAAHNTGFATFESAKQSLEPHAVELLLHMAWSSWALERGVKRAHIVNPSDGALLEELFTSKNGANTCLYHDDERNESNHGLAEEDWDAFFAAAASQGQTVATFS